VAVLTGPDRNRKKKKKKVAMGNVTSITVNAFPEGEDFQKKKTLLIPTSGSGLRGKPTKEKKEGPLSLQ